MKKKAGIEDQREEESKEEEEEREVGKKSDVEQRVEEGGAEEAQTERNRHRRHGEWDSSTYVQRERVERESERER